MLNIQSLGKLLTTIFLLFVIGITVYAVFVKDMIQWKYGALIIVVIVMYAIIFLKVPETIKRIIRNYL
ncbi:MAG TPA: hypothetical protein VK125_03045 [Bacillota bacterium]|nr:hypothetical protein [Bacillota bacterium]